MKYTLEEKLKYVKEHINNNVPIFEIHKKYGIHPSDLKYFVKLYRTWGDKAFKTNNQRQVYTRETKLKCIEDIITGKCSYREKAIELMITNPRIVCDWVEKYKAYGEESINDTYSREAYKHHDDKVLEKEYKKLLEDLERTKAENEYLKKSFPQVLKRSKQLKKK